jgi:hypothetical protein
MSAAGGIATQVTDPGSQLVSIASGTGSISGVPINAQTYQIPDSELVDGATFTVTWTSKTLCTNPSGTCTYSFTLKQV